MKDRGKIEERLADKRYRSFFEHAPIGKSMTTPDGMLQLVNPALCAMLGYDAEELAALSFAEITHPDDLDASRECVRCLLAGERDTYAMDKRYRTRDGRYVWTHVVTRLLRDEDGKPDHFLTHIQDIEQLRQAEEALRRERDRAQQYLDIVGVMVLALDADGTITLVNREGSRVLGLTEGEILGRNWMEDFIPPGDRQQVKDVFARIIAGTVEFPRFVENPVLTGSGEERLIAWHNTVVRDATGSITGTLSSGEDITERKQVEEEINTLNRELDQRVVERTLELTAANRELEAFAYSVSHDLRAPLRGIDGFSKALLDDYGDKLDDTGKDYINRVRAGTQRMGRLIDDILGLSRMTRSEMRYQHLNLEEMARKIAAELQRHDPGRSVEFRIGEGLEAHGDHALVETALSNLLGNAWKFTAERDHALIEVGVTETDGERVYFVRDNGAGFDIAYADKLFTPFQRLHDTIEFPGSGIGLAIVQRVIQRHGGRVWGEGEVGKGASLYFTLPTRNSRLDR